MRSLIRSTYKIKRYHGDFTEDTARCFVDATIASRICLNVGCWISFLPGPGAGRSSILRSCLTWVVSEGPVGFPSLSFACLIGAGVRDDVRNTSYLKGNRYGNVRGRSSCFYGLFLGL